LPTAARPEDLFRGQWQDNRTSALDEYKPYLDGRWNEGRTNARVVAAALRHLREVRHHYASVLIGGGQNRRVVQKRLGTSTS
jgi:hypothetical protein